MSDAYTKLLEADARHLRAELARLKEENARLTEEQKTFRHYERVMRAVCDAAIEWRKLWEKPYPHSPGQRLCDAVDDLRALKGDEK